MYRKWKKELSDYKASVATKELLFEFQRNEFQTREDTIRDLKAELEAKTAEYEARLSEEVRNMQ
jgi:peptidoglycan hydrolase CwlO-like protein